MRGHHHLLLRPPARGVADGARVALLCKHACMPPGPCEGHFTSPCDTCMGRLMHAQRPPCSCQKFQAIARSPSRNALIAWYPKVVRRAHGRDVVDEDGPDEVALAVIGLLERRALRLRVLDQALDEVRAALADHRRDRRVVLCPPTATLTSHMEQPYFPHGTPA